MDQTQLADWSRVVCPAGPSQGTWLGDLAVGGPRQSGPSQVCCAGRSKRSKVLVMSLR